MDAATRLAGRPPHLTSTSQPTSLARNFHPPHRYLSLVACSSRWCGSSGANIGWDDDGFNESLENPLSSSKYPSKSHPHYELACTCFGCEIDQKKKLGHNQQSLSGLDASGCCIFQMCTRPTHAHTHTVHGTEHVATLCLEGGDRSTVHGIACPTPCITCPTVLMHLLRGASIYVRNTYMCCCVLVGYYYCVDYCIYRTRTQYT